VTAPARDPSGNGAAPSAPPALGFWFDYASPFAYLGAARLAGLQARTGATLELRPLLLGALFKAIGTADVPLFTMAPPRQRMMALELYRWADVLGVPFRFATPFPQVTTKPLRVTIGCPPELRLGLVTSLFAAMWAEGADLTDDRTLAAAAERAGWSGAEAIAAATSDAMRAALRAATDAAVRAGVFGVPTFEVGGELFWGQDRAELVEEALTRGS
jgi:2-hydroxychromene-2-carboxylate isomerase